MQPRTGSDSERNDGLGPGGRNNPARDWPTQSSAKALTRYGNQKVPGMSPGGQSGASETLMRTLQTSSASDESTKSVQPIQSLLRRRDTGIASRLAPSSSASSGANCWCETVSAMPASEAPSTPTAPGSAVRPRSPITVMKRQVAPSAVKAAAVPNAANRVFVSTTIEQSSTPPHTANTGARALRRMKSTHPATMSEAAYASPAKAPARGPTTPLSVSVRSASASHEQKRDRGDARQKGGCSRPARDAPLPVLCRRRPRGRSCGRQPAASACGGTVSIAAAVAA